MSKLLGRLYGVYGWNTAVDIQEEPLLKMMMMFPDA